MTANDFRRIALGLEGVEEGTHMGVVDFRVGGRIFATLASEKLGYGNLMLTPEVQGLFLEDGPEMYLPVAGGWGRSGATHVRLELASEEVLEGALRSAWRLAVERNQQRSAPSRRKKKA